MKAKEMKVWLGIMVSVAFLMACAPGDMQLPIPMPHEMAPTPGVGSEPPTSETASPSKATPVEEQAIMERLDAQGQQLVMQARKDLAGRLNVREPDIKLLKAEAVLWSDTSLGCPEPGKMYAQVITAGYQIILEYAGQTYDYHAGRGRVILCAPAQK